LHGKPRAEQGQIYCLLEWSVPMAISLGGKVGRLTPTVTSGLEKWPQKQNSAYSLVLRQGFMS